MRTHDILPHGQQALVCTVFLRKHIPGDRLLVIDEHDVHRTVSDIADHVYAPKVRKPVCHRRKALWEHIHAHDLHMVGDISEREVYGFVLQEIIPELVPLTTDPSKRKTCRNSDFAAGHFSDIQFPRDCSTPYFGSLNKEQLERYTKQFQNPKRFFRVVGEIKAVPYKPEKDHER